MSVNTDWLRAVAREVRAWSIPGAKSLELARLAEEAATELDRHRQAAEAAGDFLEAIDQHREHDDWLPTEERARRRLAVALQEARTSR